MNPGQHVIGLVMRQTLRPEINLFRLMGVCVCVFGVYVWMCDDDNDSISYAAPCWTKAIRFAKVHQASPLTFGYSCLRRIEDRLSWV